LQYRNITLRWVQPRGAQSRIVFDRYLVVPLRMMKSRLLVFFFSVSCSTVMAQTQSSALEAPVQSDKPLGYGQHGMAVFGNSAGLFASHLPMFHAPHDTQVIFRFHLRDTAVDSALRKALTEKPALWTLDPELFDLHRLAPGHPSPLRHFTARFVEGHFERGGSERFLAQDVEIEEVLVFRPLNAIRTEGVASAGRYFVIGAPQGHFLVKEIDRRPDFDAIIALRGSKPAPSMWPEVIFIATPEMAVPTRAAMNRALKKHGFSAGRVLYFETEDLK
jgi:hypothetical protein